MCACVRVCLCVRACVYCVRSSGVKQLLKQACNGARNTTQLLTTEAVSHHVRANGTHTGHLLLLNNNSNTLLHTNTVYDMCPIICRAGQPQWCW